MIDLFDDRRYLIPFRSILLPQIFTDTLVIGAGVAGLSAAHAASVHGDVIMLAKGAISSSNSSWAQGGVAAAIAPEDTIEQVTTEGVPSPPPAEKPRPAATTTDRSPLGGISPEAWFTMLQAAAQEVWGEQWEPRLAQLLATLRRRLIGDYEVDEFGFDAEITETFTLALLRPIAEKWFRVEVRGVENIPAASAVATMFFF